jgi:DNA polymerase elongation subunit (family B)
MVYLDPVIEFAKSEVLKKDDINNRKEDDLRYTIIYTMCYILAKMIRATLRMYLTHCNVEEKRIEVLDMKNEYLFKRMMVTQNKKNYAAVMEYKEGIPMNGKLDVKGLAIRKSSTNRNASKIFERILEKKIMKCDGSPNIIDIIEDVQEFEDEIRRSLQAGESTYLKPVSVKSFEAYEDPLSNQGIRGMMIWNAIYPDQEINPPDDFFVVKTTLTRPKDLEKVADPEIREIIDELIFNSQENRIKSKGVYIFAVPRDTEIPDWIKPFIDENQIVEDTLRAFLPVMNSLGMQSIYMGTQEETISSYIEL